MFFDGNGTASCLINVNIAVERIEISSSYPGIIIQGDGITVTVGSLSLECGGSPPLLATIGSLNTENRSQNPEVRRTEVAGAATETTEAISAAKAVAEKVEKATSASDSVKTTEVTSATDSTTCGRARFRFGVNGKLQLTDSGMPLVGAEYLDTTTNIPNTVEYKGSGDIQLPITNYKLPITNEQLSNANDQGLMTNDQINPQSSIPNPQSI